ncbi:MAG: oligosaccharide repeat unit polymerase [Kangiellaceae bacterium]|nr:oligosaccharide repeat unit polymerase [Kangiellaceae bacterium]
MPKSLFPISPLALVIGIWALTVAVAVLPFAFPDTFDIAAYLLGRQGLSSDDFTPLATYWLIVAFLVFVIATATTMVALPRPQDFETDTDFDRAARITFIVNTLFVGVTLLWVALSAMKLGGFRAMLILVQLDALEAREQLLDNKLFTGMRVIYASLPASGALAATLLAAGRKTGKLSSHARKLCLISFLTNLVLLIFLPMVMSQRLLLLQLIMAAYFSVCLVHRRLVGLQYVPIGLGLFMVTWIGRESLTNANIQGSALNIGVQKLIFYFSNDLLNSFMPFNGEFEHTYGFFSLKFLMYFTQTEKFFGQLLEAQLISIDTVRGGGAWSIFTMPYVDFGAIGAAVYIAFLAVISTVVFYKGTQNVFWASAYGQFAGAYVLCTHTMYFANTNFVAMMLVIALIGGLSGRTSSAGSPDVAHVKAPPVV